MRVCTYASVLACTSQCVRKFGEFEWILAVLGHYMWILFLFVFAYLRLESLEPGIPGCVYRSILRRCRAAAATIFV